MSNQTSPSDGRTCFTIKSYNITVESRNYAPSRV